MEQDRTDFLSELPHLIVLVLLLFVLLFVVTKFKWVHCSQIPQWCNVYCTVTGSSRVAIVTGDTGDAGMGSGDELERLLNQNRIQTLVTRLHLSELSSGTLSQYELVVVTNAKDVSLLEAIALQDYLNKGGSMLWEGDALSNVSLSDDDKLYLQAQNRTNPGLYNYYMLMQNRSAAFGFLGANIGIQYVSSQNTADIIPVSPLPETIPSPSPSPSPSGLFSSPTATETPSPTESPSPTSPFAATPLPPGPVNFKSVNDHLITSGIKNFEITDPVPFAQVVNDPKLTTKIVVLNTTTREFPLIIERKFVGRVLYTAIPIEYLNSKTLLLNVFDYLVTC